MQTLLFLLLVMVSAYHATCDAALESAPSASNNHESLQKASRVKRGNNYDMLRLTRGLHMLRLGKRGDPMVDEDDDLYAHTNSVSPYLLYTLTDQSEMSPEEYYNSQFDNGGEDVSSGMRFRRSTPSDDAMVTPVPLLEDGSDVMDGNSMALPEELEAGDDGASWLYQERAIGDDGEIEDGLLDESEFNPVVMGKDEDIKRSLNMLRLGKRNLKMLRLGKRDSVEEEKRNLNMLRLGKRNLNMLRLGKRQLPMLRLGKRQLNMLRLGKREDEQTDEESKRSLNLLRLGKRQLPMLRLGKRQLNMLRLGKRQLPMLRLGKRQLNMLRLGKREDEQTNEESKRSLNQLRLGKRQLSMLRLGKRQLNMLRLGKRQLNMLRLGKREDEQNNEESKRGLNQLRLGKRSVDKRSVDAVHGKNDE